MASPQRGDRAVDRLRQRGQDVVAVVDCMVIVTRLTDFAASKTIRRRYRRSATSCWNTAGRARPRTAGRPVVVVSVFPPSAAPGGWTIASMPPGPVRRGSDAGRCRSGRRRSCRSRLHSPTRPLKSPMPALADSPGTAGGTLVAGWAGRRWRGSRGARGPWSCGERRVENASNATASGSTRRTQREIGWLGEAESARSRPGGAAPSLRRGGEVAIVRELCSAVTRGLRRRCRPQASLALGRLVRWRLSRWDPSCGRAGPDRVGLASISLQFLRDQVDPIRPARSSRSWKMHSPLPSERSTPCARPTARPRAAP